MKLTIVASALRGALDVAGKAVGKRDSLPSLSHVLLSAGDDLTVTGTDLRVRAWRTVAADVTDPGAVALPPKDVSDFLEAMTPDAAITLETTAGHKATLSHGRTVARVAGMDPETFPAAPSFADPLADTEIGAQLLARMIGSVAHAAADPIDNRPVLTGIQLRSADGTLELAAADGHRLAIRSELVAGLPDVCVIAQADRLAQAGARLAGAVTARLTVDATRAALLIESEVGCWSIALIDGHFPDFRRIIPGAEAVATTVTVDRGELVRALRLIGGITREGNDAATGRSMGRTVFARLAVTSGALEVGASDGSGDREARTTLDAEVTGRAQDITFNGGYLKAAVDALESDRATLELVGPASPALAREPGERNGHLQVLMPMHVARKGS